MIRYALLLTILLGLHPVTAQEFQPLFDGKSLAGWEGKEEFWRVENGTIVGETTKENPTKGNTFLIWKGGEVEDFEFSCEVRFQGNNSGVQYRSELVGEPAGFVLRGYQADLHPKQEYFGMLYGEKFGKRGIIATRGQRVNAKGDKDVEVLGEVGDGAQLRGEDWNTLRIVAVGNRLIHLVNDVVTVDVTENHPGAMAKGKLGLQLHAGPPMKVEFRNIRLRSLAGKAAGEVLEKAAKQQGKKESAKSSASGDWYVGVKPKPQWIWLKGTGTPQQAFFRKTFEIPAGVKEARLYSTCDNQLTLFLDGKVIGTSPDWPHPVSKTIKLEPGKHTIAAEGKNRGGIAAFVFALEYEFEGKTHHIVSDEFWKISGTAEEGWQMPGFDDSKWDGGRLVVLNSLGAQPWGIPGQSRPGGGSTANPLDPDQITSPPGFVVEHVYTVPKGAQGSWVSLTVDPEGRFYASDQQRSGLFRIAVSESAGGPEASVSRVEVRVPGREEFLSGAQGLQYAFGSLFFHRNGGHLYRIDDDDGDGEFDTVHEIPSQTGGGEHGNHDVIVTEDGAGLYLAGGNHAPLGEVTRSAVTSWDEDLLLPRMWDARGHARGRLAPGGWITRLDPEKLTQEVISTGYRNQYGLALNEHGDLFTYDADMEWDMGMPWYRPTRICHAVSGSEYGWRSGTGKWPTYFEDTLPPVVEIGPGSPTGVISGKGAKFPEKYRKAIFALDWTFGTIYAIHLEEHGAGYRGRAEAFVHGAPLPVTDAVIGRDGRLYFLIGGRGTQSAMFRVGYEGDAGMPVAAGDPAAAEARQLRRSLERFHGIEHEDAVGQAWPHLSSEDRFIRHAARVAIESQPVGSWAEKYFSSNDPQTVITGGVALARSGEKSQQARLLEKLLSLEPGSLPEARSLGLLRAISLTFIRLGEPDRKQAEKVIARFDPLLPAKSDDLNNELLKLLVYLRAPSAVEKGMALITGRGEPEIPDWSELISRNSRYGGTVKAMLDNYPPSREIGYALMLSNVREGWTEKQRRDYFTFLNEAAKRSGGASYPGFLANIRAQALGNCSNEERAALSDITGEDFNPVPDFTIHPPKGPGKVWTLGEAVSAGSARGADFENGRSLYFAVGCGACHRHAGLGGGVGPDLTTIPTKFDERYLLEAIIDPSKDISDQYGSSIVTMKDGTVHTGIAIEQGEKLEIYLPDARAEPVVVAASDVKTIEASPVSQMPPGLINALNREELRDLTAYLMSGGNRDDRRFKK